MNPNTIDRLCEIFTGVALVGFAALMLWGVANERKYQHVNKLHVYQGTVAGWVYQEDNK